MKQSWGALPSAWAAVALTLCLDITRKLVAASGQHGDRRMVTLLVPVATNIAQLDLLYSSRSFLTSAIYL